MANILKEYFELWVKKRWLLFIERELIRQNNLRNRWKRQGYVVKRLVNRYNELYPDERIYIK